jgi:hypothetical protein
VNSALAVRGNVMTGKGIFILTFVVVLSACQGEPGLVYVPSTEPEVELVVRASATEVSVGEPVVLYAERRTGGEWKQVERRELADGQRWLSRPPPTQEPEVAGNLRWEVLPPASARFNTAFRADHTREVVFLEAGTFILESSSIIWCRPGKVARGQPIKIVVGDDKTGAKTGQ